MFKRVWESLLGFGVESQAYCIVALLMHLDEKYQCVYTRAHRRGPDGFHNL